MLRFAVFFGLLIVITIAFRDDRFIQSKETNSDELSIELSSKSNDFDIITMTQMWPQTTCWSLNHKWSNKTNSCSPCDMPESKQAWTLHGVWPSSSYGAHPSFCEDVSFNLKLMSKSLLAQMKKKWPSFNLYMSNERFWRHEWNKHGTCALSLSNTNTLPKYFSYSLQLLDKYNIGRILAEADIVPGKKYDFQDVVGVVEKTLGVDMEFLCSTHEISRELYLNEVGLCLDKSFQPVDCPRSRKRCYGQVWYPEPRDECGMV